MNRGYDAQKTKWQEAEGKAYFVNDPGEGFLKVSFFGPFYGAYVILELDADYQHVLVAGPSRDYLWLLARSPHMDESVLAALLAKAKALGFATDKLIFVDHNAT